MSLKTRGGIETLWRALVVTGLVAGMLFLGSCGGSKEAATSTDDAALTSFIGEKPVQAQPSEVAVGEVDRELAELKAENTQLKQKILTLEEANRALNTNLSETDLQLIAEKARADSLARLSAMSGTHVAASSGAPAAYEEALMSFRARQYDDAIGKLQGLLDAGVEDRYADNCQYWLGECQFAKRSYSRAVSHFENVLATKASEKKGDAAYMVGRCYEQLGNTAQAREAYQSFVTNYPTNRLIPRAQERLGKL